MDLSLEISLNKAAETIKQAILDAQYEAAKGVNNIQLMLYYSVGRFISLNTRRNKWGTNAIATISQLLKQDMPGLRGFSESNIKKMRIFYEEWSDLDENKSFIQTNEFENVAYVVDPQSNTISFVQTNEIQIQHFNFPSIDAFPANDFRSIGFTHHYNILAGCKKRDERLFYISLCAREHLTPDGISNCIKQNLYAAQGQLPNNFLQKLPSGSLAKRAILAFKDQYMLDFINVEELGARDIEEVNETVVEQQIVENIKQFILRFGKDFCLFGSKGNARASVSGTAIVQSRFFVCTLITI